MRSLPIAVAAFVLLWISPARAVFPGANGVLAVQPPAGGGIVLVGADGRGARRICVRNGTCGRPQRPRWSPDGRALVFAGPAIRIVYADGSCMSCQFGAAPNPAFEPGGTLITFVRRRQLSVDAIDGNRRPSPDPGVATDAVWSATGSLAVVRSGAVWAGRPGRLRRLAAGTEPSWSPSGNAVAAVQRGWVVIVRDRRVRRLVRGSAPAFSPDGRLIAYVARGHRLMVARVNGGPAPRRVGGVRAVSVDWQPRPRGANPGCVAPPGSRTVASSADAVVTGDGLPLQGLGFDNAPPIAYMGCLRSDRRERLLERFAQNNVNGASVVNSAVLAAPYAGLVVYSLNAHYGGEWNTMQVFDLRTGLLTKLGGETTGCDFMGCPFAGFDRVVLGNDGMSAVHVHVVDSIGSLSTAIKQVSCAPASTICIAIDGPARLLSSTDPAAGAAAWTTGTLTGGLFAIACPTTSLCLAVGTNGALEISTDPAAGTWTRTRIDDGRRLTSIACATSSLCVAADSTGHVVASTNPTAGPSAWTPALVDGDPCTDTTPCSEESIQAADMTGIRTVDSSKLPGAGPYLTDLTLTGDVLSWGHNGTPKSVTLAAP